MHQALQGLAPERLWHYFGEISAIPRCSGKEARVAAYLQDWATAQGFRSATDAVGNVVVYVPAAAGLEQAPTLILQNHMDMVGEKNKATAFDFDTDPIRLLRDGDRLKADGTTLGADNGIGMAAAMAVAELKSGHGPLELLFTVEEETGLKGAANIDTSLLHGKAMINLDTEEYGHIYVGCAGGGTVQMELPLKADKPKARQAYALVTVSGLKGGHSGIDIHFNRGNATKLLARLLEAAHKAIKIRLAVLEGGDKHNAIPREASAVVALPVGKVGALRDLAAELREKVLPELAPGHSLTITVEETAAPETTYNAASTEKAIALLLALPHGPLAMSLEVPGLVQSSTNLAVSRLKAGMLSVLCSPRSSIDNELLALVEQIGAIGLLAGASVEGEVNYNGWKPDPGSPLLAQAKAVSVELFGKEFAVAAIHAGLECGILGAKLGGLDKISMGPDIKNPHSPDEYVDIPSCDTFFRYFQALVAAFARGARTSG